MNEDHSLLNVLTQKGVLANVNIRYWRACKKLNAEDIGLPVDEHTMRLISLGHKKLLPREALHPFALIESRAHAAVEKASFAFLGGMARFVPNSCLGGLMPQLRDLEYEFADEQRRFLDNYVTLREQALDEWRDVAFTMSRNPAQLIGAISASFPSLDRVSSRFVFQTHLYQIAVPEAVNLELTDYAAQQARQDAAREAGVHLHEQVDLFVQDAVATLREQTAKLCDEMVSSMNSSPSFVHQKTLNRLTKFIDEFRKLNFAGDQELEYMLNDARERLLSRSAEEYREDRVASSRLVQGLESLADKARNMAQEDTQEIVSRFGALGQRKLCVAA